MVLAEKKPFYPIAPKNDHCSPLLTGKTREIRDTRTLEIDSYMCSAAVAIPGEIMFVWCWRNGGVIPNQWHIDQRTWWI